MHETLLRDAVVDKNGYMPIKITKGAHLTSNVVVEVKQRKSAQEGRCREAEKRELAAACKKSGAEIRHSVHLAPVGRTQRHRLAQPCKARRQLRRAKARVEKLSYGGG